MKIALQFKVSDKYYSEVKAFLMEFKFSFLFKKTGSKWLFHVKDVEDSEDFAHINEFLSVLIPTED